MSNLPRQHTELLLQQLDQLPTLPSVAIQVLQVAAADTSSVKDVSVLIESDPALSSRILQLVHRADLGVSGEVSSIERAVVLLGFEAVRCAVLAISVFATFQPKSTTTSSFSRNEFWKHCIATGCAAELIAAQLKVNWGRSAGVEPSTAFTAGLLHDVGKIALDAAIPKSFARVVEASEMLRGNIADVERNVIGVDHTIIGKRLAEKWRLPAAIRDAIWLHGQTPQALPTSVRNDRLVNIITLADLLVREQHLGYSGNYTFPIPRQLLVDELGMLPSQIEEINKKLADQIESRARSLGLGSSEAQDLYRDALQQAHKELSRVTDQLSAKNRKLSLRAKYFEALAGFQSELRPDAPPAMVSQAIGQTAVDVLETPVVAVFSMPPGVAYAEVSLIDKNSDHSQTQLIEMQAILGELGEAPAVRPMPGDGPVLSVGEQMEWLIQAFSPKLSGSNRYWICLEADSACIGGVIWGGDPGEAQRLSAQVQELTALASGWSLAMRTCQIRDESRALAEQLADANRRLQSVQSEIVRTRMLTTVAEMAAGAAHEMNNPLMVISGRSQLLAGTLEDPKQKQAAQLIYEKSQKLSDIITELMHFARPQSPQFAPATISGLFEYATNQTKGRPEIADRQIETLIGDVPMVDVDGNQVGSAIAEIVDNAIQATDPQSGHIMLAASFDAFSQQVILTITDDGYGMDENVLRHAFDPFFSALRAGRREGMGLAKALRWIESSGGSLRLESAPGKGTRAIIVLPASRSRMDQPASRERRAR